jgi:hypothetical protein
MRYVLPHPHTPLEAGAVLAPAPAASARLAKRGVSTRVIGGGGGDSDSDSEQLTVAVVKFSGYATPDVVFAARGSLTAGLTRDGVRAGSDDTVMIAQYNELFSLPWNRDNEVWLPCSWPRA